MNWIITLATLFVFALCVARIRATLITWTVSFGFLVVILSAAGLVPGVLALLLWPALIGLVLLNVSDLRRQYLTVPLLQYLRRLLPPISATERTAIEAGSVWWDAELFRGDPDWNKLTAVPPSGLTDAEQAFLDGPAEKLCAMLDDWKITHNLNDLPKEVWQFMAKERFWAVNIPKRYGGLEFSPEANSAIVMKVASRSGSAGVTVMVPNSLGPAELLLDYGTEQQKNHYLPRLARGEEIPCFALTHPYAGSDAGAIPDFGIVCRAEHEGRETLGLRVTWNKRYITLGPVATLLGLAFKAYDPDRLLGGDEELGITCALVPTGTAGVRIGDRHLPLNAAFQNGPNSGDAVFIPMDWVIGGQERVGRGWSMLMESLATGRGISLPASSVAAAKIAARATGAYARIREQFNRPIGTFEGVSEVLARIGGLTYMMDAARLLTLGGLKAGEKPAIVSAIVKYQLTEGARQVINDAMDVHGGRAICMGPRNYLARAYQQIPIGITVEGANILTRSMIIFGQGAMRCHPYLLQEIELAGRAEEHTVDVEEEFDEILLAHMGYTFTNAARAFTYGLSANRFAPAPERGDLMRYYRYFSRYSAAFAALSDLALLMLGGQLKRRESLSGRFADVLIHLYMGSAVLKIHADQGEPVDDRCLVEWACEYCAARIEEALDGVLQNFPNRWIGYAARAVIFPLGRRKRGPRDEVNQSVADLLLSPSGARDRLTAGIYLDDRPDDILGVLEDAMRKAAVAEPVRRRLHNARIFPAVRVDYATWVHSLVADKVIRPEEGEILNAAYLAADRAIQVDSFAGRSRTRKASPKI